MNKPLFFICLFMGLFASGQENTWSLQRCIDAALQNNIEIKIRQLQITKAQKLYTHPLLELFPTVSLSGNHSYNFGSTIDPTTNARVSSDIQWDNFYLNAGMNLLDFGSLATAQKGKIDIAVAKADKAVIEYEYKLLLLEKYYDALFSQELAKIQQEQLQNTVFTLERIEKEVGIGSKPQSDLYDIRLGFSQEEKRLLEAQQMFAAQKMQLFQLMNVRPENLETVVLEAYTVTGSGAAPETQHPKIAFAELSYQSVRKETAVLRSGNLPVLSAFYGLSTFYSSPLNQPGAGVVPFSTQFSDNKNHQAGLQLTVPVFNGFRKSRQISASKIETEKSKLMVAQEKLKMEQQIELETTRRDQYLQLTDNLKNTLKYAKESFRTTESKFISGRIEAVIYTSVKNQLLASEYDFLKNSLMVNYAALKINLIRKNEL